MEEHHLSLTEAAGRLDISERTARRWIKSGKLRAYKPGRDYRIPESAIQQVMEESVVLPKESVPPDPQQSFNGLLEEERREALVRSCVEYALSRAERWEVWLAEGDRELLGEMVLEYDSLARFLINDILQTTRGLGDAGVSLGTEVMRALDRLSRTMRQALGTIEQTDAENARRARTYLERWSA